MSQPIDARDLMVGALCLLPADASLEDIREEFETMCDVIAGLEDEAAGRTIPHAEVVAEIRTRRERYRLGSAEADIAHVSPARGP
jgi:hypothetical protein